MRRLCGALTPAAFFLGLTLLSASIIEYARWPFTYLRLVESDFDVDLMHAWVPEVSDRLEGLALRNWLGLAALLAVAGLVRLIRGHQRSGAAMIATASVLGVFPSIALSLLLRVIDPIQWANGPAGRSPPTLPPLLVDAVVFTAFASMISAIAWLISQRMRGLPIDPSTWVAAGIALSLIGVALIVSGEAAHRLDLETLADVTQWPRPLPVPPDRPVLLLAGLLFAGLALSVTRPLYVSRFVSTVVLVTGLAASIPAIAIAHDARIETHPQVLSMSNELATPQPQSTWCPLAEFAPVVQVTRSEVLISGMTMADRADGLRVEAPVFANVSEMHLRDADLQRQAGGPFLPRQSLTLQADATTPIATIEGIGRAAQRADLRFLDLISIRDSPGGTWLVPTVHRHDCAIRIELSPDGRPISGFADYESLFRAAEQARGTLRVQMFPQG